jgi:hypothetical protein
MVNYGFKVGLDTPNLIEIAQKAKERDELQARKNYEDRIKLMQMLGRGVGAYKMGQDYRDWKADQNMWNSELDSLNGLSDEYDAAQDQYDIDAADRLIANMYETNPYALPGNAGADQEDFALYELGLL